MTEDAIAKVNEAFRTAFVIFTVYRVYRATVARLKTKMWDEAPALKVYNYYSPAVGVEASAASDGSGGGNAGAAVSTGTKNASDGDSQIERANTHKNGLGREGRWRGCRRIFDCAGRVHYST